jgi:glycosyltransferase involved in cell wall biosynthesis
MTAPYRPCVLVPTYDNPTTIRRVVESARRFVDDVVVVDDGSAPEGRRAVEEVGALALAHVVHRAQNGGKGAAVKTGFVAARDLGCSHALQVDADGQHETGDIPRFLEASRAAPGALVLGEPVFDATAPKSRLVGRKITQFWTNLETFGRVIHDPMCGFRVYPLEAAIAARARGNAMDFDPEIAVRLSWAGVPILNIPTKVRYVSAAEGGVSHFRMGTDNLLISWMHTRMVVGALLRLPARVGRWRLRP